MPKKSTMGFVATATGRSTKAGRVKSRQATVGAAPPVPHRTKTKAAKSAVFNLRVALETQALIDRAAAAQGQTRTEFVLQSAVKRAQDVVLDQRLFTLSGENWSTFAEALDNPPPANAELKALLARVPLWERA